MEAQVAHQGTPLLLPAFLLAPAGGASLRQIGEQGRRDTGDAVVDAGPALLDGGYGHVQGGGHFLIGLVQKRVPEQGLLAGLEIEPGRVVHEQPRDVEAGVGQRFLARDPQQVRALARWPGMAAVVRPIFGADAEATFERELTQALAAVLHQHFGIPVAAMHIKKRLHLLVLDALEPLRGGRVHALRVVQHEQVQPRPRIGPADGVRPQHGQGARPQPQRQEGCRSRRLAAPRFGHELGGHEDAHPERRQPLAGRPRQVLQHHPVERIRFPELPPESGRVWVNIRALGILVPHQAEAGFDVGGFQRAVS